MESADEDSWLDNIIHRRPGYEVSAVDEFADRLVQLARSRLPDRLLRRVDPEDVVQSVFKSFFSRHEAGRFHFAEASDVWRLLAAITWHKVQRTIRHHQQHVRNVQKDEVGETHASQLSSSDPTASSLSVMIDLLDHIMARLPEKHRQILRLRMEDYSVDEIAETVGVSSRTVDRALALVRKVAAESIDDEPPLVP